jgi:hypothetical protein
MHFVVMHYDAKPADCQVTPMRQIVYGKLGGIGHGDLHDSGVTPAGKSLSDAFIGVAGNIRV